MVYWLERLTCIQQVVVFPRGCGALLCSFNTSIAGAGPGVG